MSITRNRELSQFGSFIHIDDNTQSIGITTDATPFVGIGTTNPSVKLEVIGDTNIIGTLDASSYTLNGSPLVDATIEFFTFATNNVDIFRLPGNVGIGTSVFTERLTVNGNVSAGQFISTVTTGTAPLIVSSTTQISNLNASLLAGKTPPTGDIVGTTDTQTLTNKTLTSPIISSIVNGNFTSTIPSVNGTLVSTGSTGTVTSNMIADLSIANADIAVGAGITYGKLSLTNSILAADIAVGAGITYGKLSLTGFITNADINASAGISVSKLSANTISGIALGNNLATLTFGTYLTGTSYNGSTAVTIATNATSANTLSAIVARDGSGDFTAGTITATSFVGSGANLTGVSAGSTVADDTTTNATFYPVFTQTTSGIITASKVSTTNLQFNPSTGTLSATQFTSLSDGTQKTNIRPVENATYIVSQMNGVYYDWIDDHNAGSVGVIAQEIEKVLPEVVTTNDQGLKTVSYGNIVGVLIEAIKEQQVRIEELERKINA